MRSLYDDTHADTRMIGGVIGILVTLIIAVLVFYNITASIDMTTLDDDFNLTGAGASETPVSNASNAVLDQAATFFTIAPIIAIVVVAVVVLKYVGSI